MPHPSASRSPRAKPPHRLRLAAALALLAAATPQAARAACATDPGAGPGHLQVCRTTGHTLSVRLEAKPATVTIGRYRVATETFNGRYVPPVLSIDPGHRLAIHLDNDLPDLPSGAPNTINLHTHGLIVSPKNPRAADAPAGPGMPMTDHTGGDPALDPTLVHGPGDNVYVTIKPQHAFDYRIDIPNNVTAAGQILSRHPEGLFWYHPHIHERAQRQVAAGMASAILIGSPKNALRRATGGGPPMLDPALIGKIDEQVLILKDIELFADKLPNQIAANTTAPADWIGKDGDDGFLPTGCTGAPRGAAWCVPAIPAGPGKQAAWLFTVNGQVVPRMTAKKGRYLLLRIANTSPSVTYALRLAKAPKPGTDPTTTPPDTSDANVGGKFAILAIDGTVPGQIAQPTPFARTTRRGRPAPPPLPKPVQVQQLGGLLLLPASRAEVLVIPDADGSDLVLQTVGFRAGAQPPPDPGGPELADLWPAMDLATIHLAGQNTPPANLWFQPLVTLPTAPATPPDAPLPPGCTQAALGPNQFRRIFLDSDATTFKIGSQIVTANADGTETIDAPSNIDPVVMPMMGPGAWPTTKHVCVRQGSVETWEIVNLTNEIHNFHIHQSKFRLAPGSKPVDPNHMLANIPIFAGGVLDDITAWHDTFPIPPTLQTLQPDPDNPGQHIYVPDPTQPGRVRLVISFAADQQVGRFVFHCHILEHEDKGMMAPIEVLAAAP